MEKEKMLVKYHIKKINRKINHTVGTVLSFTHPKIAYIKRGRAEFFYQGKTVHAQSGDLLYIAMHTRYYSVWYGSPDIEFYTIDFAFAAPYLFYEYKFQVLKGFFAETFEEMYQTYQTAPFISIAEFYTFLERLYANLISEKNFKKYTDIEPAINYIENNFTQPIDIQTLARLCSCSESTLFKTFNSVMEVSPITYKHNVMIQHALDLLVHTEFSVEEISRRTGFASSNYFRKIFLKITGKTPKQIRKS